MFLSTIGLLVPAPAFDTVTYESDGTLIERTLIRVSNGSHGPLLNMLPPLVRALPSTGSALRNDRPSSPEHDETFESLVRSAHVLAPLDGPEHDVGVNRYPHDRSRTNLVARIRGQDTLVEYNYLLNAFRPLDEEQDYISPEPPGTELVPLDDLHRTVTEEQRTTTLRGMGSGMSVRVDFTTLRQPANAEPIPKKIMSIWLGDKIMTEPYLTALARNSSLLKGSDYKPKLFLTTEPIQTYLENREILRTIAPNYTVVPLERQPVFDHFRVSPYYGLYQAALKGDGSTTYEASATDILRYQILRHEGGLYMDCDDTLLGPGEKDTLDNEALVLDKITLKTRHGGLLVGAPGSLMHMGLRLGYASNLLGSSPENPLLDQICDEMLARYGKHPGFYSDPKPDLLREPERHKRWAMKIGYLTGAHVLNFMIEQQLTELHQLKETYDYLMMPKVSDDPVDIDAFLTATDDFWPLNRCVRTGRAMGWA